MSIEYLPWDTSFFKIKIGKIENNNDLSFKELENDFFSNEFNLVYLFSQEYIKPENSINLSIDLVDIMITMSCNLDKITIPLTNKELINTLSDEKLLEVYKIAEEISLVSRFSKESLIGVEKTKEFYRKWIDNSLNKSYADGLFIFSENNKVAGLHSIKTDKENQIGSCSIIGVDQHLKGSGIGKMLWNYAFNYWKSLGYIKKCMVPFSLNNKQSFNFHLKMGFNVIEEIKYIYHIKKR